MTQLALLFSLHVLGLAVCLAWGPRRHPVVCCAVAFPTGVAIAAGLVLASLYLNVTVLASAVGGSCLILAAAIRVASARWRPGRLDLVVLGAGGAVFLGLAALFTSHDVTFLTHESNILILTAQTLDAEVTSLDVPLLRLLSELGPLPAAAYGLADLADLGFLQALQPMLLASLVVGAGAIAGRGAALLGAPRWVALVCSGLGAASLLLHPAVLRGGLCVMSSSFIPAYLMCFLGTWWLAEVEDDATMIPVALVGLVALFLISDVAALLGLACFAVAILPSRLADRDLDVPVGVAVAVLIAWLGAAGIDFPEGDARYFSFSEAQQLFIGLLAVYLLWVAGRTDAVRRLVRLLPAFLLAVATALTVAAVVAGLDGLDHAAASAGSSLGKGGWTATWAVVVILAAVGLFAGRMPGERLLTFVVPVCGLAMVWFGTDAKPDFFVSPLGDVQMLASAAFAIASLYLVIKGGWVLGAARAGDREGEPSERSRREIGIAAAALAAGLLLFNLHLIDIRDTRFARNTLRIIDTPSIVDAARRGGVKTRFQYAVYFTVAARTDGGTLRLPSDLRYHAPYFRDLASLEVTEGPAFLPSSAVAALRPLVNESWKFDLRRGRGDARDIHFIWGQGVRDWILALTPDRGPVFWMPRDLYLKSGGVP